MNPQTNMMNVVISDMNIEEARNCSCFCFTLRAKKSLATSYSPTAVCRSTIGAGGLNFRVRNGNGWVPSALVTRQIEYSSTYVAAKPEGQKSAEALWRAVAAVGLANGVRQDREQGKS